MLNRICSAIENVTKCCTIKYIITSCLIFRSRVGQVLEMNAERRERLEAQGDFAIGTQQHLSDIWHKALGNPNENQEEDNSTRAR